MEERARKSPLLSGRQVRVHFSVSWFTLPRAVSGYLILITKGPGLINDVSSSGEPFS